MDDIAQQVKDKLDNIVSQMSEKSHLFVTNPDKDFTRNRTFTFEKTIKAASIRISLRLTRLVGPCMLVGTFGYVIGTWLGIIIGSILGA